MFTVGICQKTDRFYEKMKNSIESFSSCVGRGCSDYIDKKRSVWRSSVSGKDSSSKIVIKDNQGNVVKVFDSDDGCDFCEGSGKDWAGNPCHFCQGQGKVGINPCKSCDGEKRILGKQKINGIKLTGQETKIDTMGHFSKDGIVGYLLLKKKLSTK
jgi:DnaJ-class molecular chaperone